MFELLRTRPGVNMSQRLHRTGAQDLSGRRVLVKKTVATAKNPSSPLGARVEAIAFSALALLIGGLTTIVMVDEQKIANVTAARMELDAVAERFANDLHDRLQKYEYGLRGARGAFAAMGPDKVSRDAFVRYSKSRDIDTEFPGARGFGFIKKVSLLDIEDFILFQHENGVPDFRIKQLSDHSNDRFVIQYVEPIERNREAVGLDIASEKNRRTAAIEAALSGKVAITETITILQASGAVNRGFLVLLPVYEIGSYTVKRESTLEEVVGWTYAPLVLDEVISGLTDRSTSIHWTISDYAESGDRNTILTAGAKERHADAISATKSLTVFNRTWEVEAVASQAFLANTEKISPAKVGAIGLGISILSSVIVYLWATGRRRRLMELESQARLATVIRNTNQAVVGTDDSKSIVLWNSAAEALFGTKVDDAVGRRFDDVLASKGLALDERSGLQGASQTEFWLKGQGAALRLLVASKSPILASDGRTLGSATFMLDVTDERRAEQQAAKDTEDFAYTVAHDLRTPLRSVNGFSAMLMESEGDRLTEKGRKSLDTVIRSSQRMGMMLTNLIDYLHVVKQAASKEELDMHRVVEEAKSLLATKELPFEPLVRPMPRAYADRLLIRQLLLAILDNSIKYSSPKRKLAVIIGFDEAEAAYFVSDNGLGFDAENSPKLFGLFQRLEVHPDIPGLGIGLAIAKRIIDKHGGQIWARAEKGVGATIFFQLPPAIASELTEKALPV